jgi:hypothetical protein
MELICLRTPNRLNSTASCRPSSVLPMKHSTVPHARASGTGHLPRDSGKPPDRRLGSGTRWKNSMQKLEKTIQQMPNFDKLKHQIEMTITAEGLRIEMMETETGIFFDVASPRPTALEKNCSSFSRRN